MKREIKTAPSLLSANFGNMAGAVTLIEQCHGDLIHFDVMDGSFVPDITFGHKMIADLRPLTKLEFDVHLMVNHPETFIENIAKAGADTITIQLESAVHIHSILTTIKALGKSAGIAIVPTTPAFFLDEILAFVDQVIIMTVNPGFGGQKMISEVLPKISYLKKIKEQKGYNFRVEVDGGINRETAKTVVDAGADILVAGSAFFNDKKPSDFIDFLKKLY